MIDSLQRLGNILNCEQSIKITIAWREVQTFYWTQMCVLNSEYIPNIPINFICFLDFNYTGREDTANKDVRVCDVKWEENTLTGQLCQRGNRDSEVQLEDVVGKRSGRTPGVMVRDVARESTRSCRTISIDIDGKH
ncbi:hypothetical protein NPIL_484061 [Nephila pilipes]|uniref:Uncharacterized protein n=1 Tax=Nephila pilipes TaxID=299642 RepID=A0A8X6TJK6_NEPPI|nr:hypothetical protein NPIL_484061 [Nephila pilipes]